MQASESLQRLISAMGVPSHGRMAIGIAFTDGVPLKTHLSYRQEFLEAYKADGLAEHDPTLQWGMVQTGARTWSDLVADGFGGPRLFETARAFGMRDGLCFSIQVMRWRSIATMVVNDPASVSDRRRQNIMDLLKLATIECVEDRFGRLKRRTQELLEAQIRCSTDQEISDLLGITVSGVRRRRQQMLDEMNVRSLPEAIHRATLSGAIS